MSDLDELFFEIIDNISRTDVFNKQCMRILVVVVQVIAIRFEFILEFVIFTLADKLYFRKMMAVFWICGSEEWRISKGFLWTGMKELMERRGCFGGFWE